MVLGDAGVSPVPLRQALAASTGAGLTGHEYLPVRNDRSSISSVIGISKRGVF
jgi:hypothetical protein